jgi:hypothetical protein
MTDSGLSPEEMDRIQKEELFRSKVRKEVEDLAAQSETVGTLGSIWSFLNSNFGLWLLSAVVISGLGTLYSNHQAKLADETAQLASQRSAKAATNELYERLTIEISFRLSSALATLHEAEKLDATKAAKERQRETTRALALFFLPATDQAPPLFPDFKSYSGVALIAEMRRHAPIGEKQQLKEILASASTLLYETSFPGRNLDAGPREVAGVLLEKLQYPKWDNGFPYTDCSKEMPFC